MVFKSASCDVVLMCIFRSTVYSVSIRTNPLLLCYTCTFKKCFIFYIFNWVSEDFFLLDGFSTASLSQRPSVSTNVGKDCCYTHGILRAKVLFFAFTTVVDLEHITGDREQHYSSLCWSFSGVIPTDSWQDPLMCDGCVC